MLLFKLLVKVKNALNIDEVSSCMVLFNGGYGIFVQITKSLENISDQRSNAK